MNIEEFKKNENMYWYVRAMKYAERTYPGSDYVQLLQLTAKKMAEEIIPCRQRNLLQIAFAKELTQSMLDEFLCGWDIETVTSQEALLLLYVMLERSELDFGKHTGPRLHGLKKYYQFRNLELIPHFYRVVGALNEQNIFPVVIKGGAIKHMRPELPRVMSDIDIVLSSEREWHIARSTAKNLGYEYLDAGHSIDLHIKGQTGRNTLDVHRKLPFCRNIDEKFLENMVSRASYCRIFGAEGYVPAPEDMVFIILGNMARNIRENSSLKGIPFSLIDLNYLINRKGFSWDTVARNITETGSEAYFYMIAHFVNSLVPDMIPTDFMKGKAYHTAIYKLLESDRNYIRKFYDSKLMCRLWMLRKKIRKWEIFTRFPWLVNIYMHVKNNVINRNH